MKLTGIYTMKQKPIREGVYRVVLLWDRNCEAYSFFRDGKWHTWSFYKDAAAQLERRISQDAYDGNIVGWRGLAENPEGGAA
ncbi:hypothetical protein [Herbaspirillum aquaticum]|uniref:hypothetical protein n=1 Tax=Herbaspirillum aquaticum TaxID=568783 RepID=UPI0024DE2031|nr:hypothetical protein [Herbaspirillum aquaticum]